MGRRYQVARPETWADLRYFQPSEFEYPEKMDDGLLLMLDSARLYAGIPFVITDDWRPDGPGDSAHEYGLAVDIRCHYSHDRWLLVFALKQAGFRRLGVYDAHIHADADSTKAQNVMWLGVSR